MATMHLKFSALSISRVKTKSPLLMDNASSSVQRVFPINVPLKNRQSKTACVNSIHKVSGDETITEQQFLLSLIMITIKWPGSVNYIACFSREGLCGLETYARSI